MDRLPIFAPYQLDQCGWVANRYAEAMNLSDADKLALLTQLDPLERLEAVSRHMMSS
jgi:hypothetical protein